MRLAIWLLSVLVCFFLAGAIPMSGILPSPAVDTPIPVEQTQTEVFRTPAFILLMGTLCLLLLWAVARKLRRFKLRHTGFILAHLGIVVLMLGALMFTALGRVADRIELPASPMHGAPMIPLRDGTLHPLGFTISISEFHVEFYNDDHGRPGRTPKHFLATLRILDDQGADTSHELKVNHPVAHGGWRFYLTNYRPFRNGYIVSLSAKQDPGRPFAIAGIWMIIVGVALTCLQSGRRFHASA